MYYQAMHTILKNKSAVQFWGIVLGFSLLFILLSATIALRQLSRDTDKVSGQIVSVSGQSVVIVDARGRETVLHLNDDTRLMKGDFKSLVPGVFIYSFGDRVKDGEFNSHGIRVMK